ncbi:hypothetical protein IRJ41_014914 [Triplophysa rosa]|uniref:Uncharacterized protein n=1 Tax=Triplophysa rosa TaxID=992332 RepID=A0A9W7T9G8_TRIRA|nr:hypothetical protein IRJ41_014914 [Triplophysa rosa]
MMGRFGISLCLLLLCVLCGDSRPVHNAADTVRELVEILRSMNLGQEGPDTEPMGSSEILLPKEETLEKRYLPRLGVSVYRVVPSRVHSSKSLDASRDRFSSPAKWMSSLQG